MIRVEINGKERQLQGPVPLDVLIADYIGETDPRGVAAGVNGDVVRRNDWSEIRVEDGDRIEIIAPFAGG